MNNDIGRYWYIYSTCPIDLYWECLRTVKETYKSMCKEFQLIGSLDCSGQIELAEFVSMYERVKSLASDMAGWSMDNNMRSDDTQCVFWIPTYDSGIFEYGFVWKDDSGTCWVASPMEMPWLKYDESEYRVFDRFGIESEDGQNEVGSQAYVYVIESVGVGKVKIGLSSEPEKRLKQLQTGSSHELKLLLVIPGTSILEHDLHAKFSHIRAEGEWFYATKELREWIESHAEQNDGI